MKKMIKRLLKNENGNMVVTVALFMTFLLGIVGLAIDGGRLYAEKSTLQKALDASVLGGAQVIVGKGEAEAITVAKNLAIKNSYSLDGSTISTTGTSIKVMQQVTVPMTFARFIGFNDAVVTASAKAMASPLYKGTGITPIAVEKDEIPNGTELKCESTGIHHGNCGYLALDGKGAKTLEEGILNGVEVDVGSMETVDSEPGQKWGPVKGAFEELIARDADKSHCQSPDTADNECSRVIYIVVIDSWDDANGSDQVSVVGLAAYWLEAVDKNDKRVTGRFIKTIAPGEIGARTDYGLYGVKLVE